jgi:hypothetical protein
MPLKDLQNNSSKSKSSGLKALHDLRRTGGSTFRNMDIKNQHTRANPVKKSTTTGNYYIGVRNPKICAFGELTQFAIVNRHPGRFFLLTEDEARQAWGPGYKDFWAPEEGGYLAAYVHSMMSQWDGKGQ